MQGEESQLRTNFVKTLPEHVPRWFNVRLGVWHDAETARFYSVVMKYADLIYFDNNEIHIVEFKVRKQTQAIGQLLSYRQEFKKTVEFGFYRKYNIKLMLIVNVQDKVAEELANRNRIQYNVLK